MKNQACQTKHSQSGNVMFIILIAIALFAALSYVLMKTSRSSASISQEEARLKATDIIGYLNKVKQAVDTLIINGCPALSINFSTPVYLRFNDTLINTPPPDTTPQCDLYSVSGGAIKATTFDRSVSSSYPNGGTTIKGGHFATRYVAIENSSAQVRGTTKAELIYYSEGFRVEICQAVLNITRNLSLDTALSVESFTSASTDSYTTTTFPAGHASALIWPPESNIFSIKRDSASNNYCIIGIILRTY